jgi:enterochelin esterase-like enzyme
VHDGGAALGDGDWAKSLDNLLGYRVRPLLAVFIEVQAGRNLDGYAAMVADELVPWVDATFRTVAEPSARAHVGAARGAYWALDTVTRRPGVALRVGVQSPFMFDTDLAALAASVRGAAEQPLVIYLDWGKYDLRNPHEAWDVGAFSREFAELLRARGYAPQGGEAHDGTGWASWRNRTDRLLEALFPAAE